MDSVYIAMFTPRHQEEQHLLFENDQVFFLKQLQEEESLIGKASQLSCVAREGKLFSSFLIPCI